jgi:hypothetical protein
MHQVKQQANPQLVSERDRVAWLLPSMRVEPTFDVTRIGFDVPLVPKALWVGHSADDTASI